MQQSSPAFELGPQILLSVQMYTTHIPSHLFDFLYCLIIFFLIFSFGAYSPYSVLIFIRRIFLIIFKSISLLLIRDSVFVLIFVSLVIPFYFFLLRWFDFPLQFYLFFPSIYSLPQFRNSFLFFILFLSFLTSFIQSFAFNFSFALLGSQFIHIFSFSLCLCFHNVTFIS